MAGVGARLAPHWRAMRASDLDAVKRLSDDVHRGLPERREVLAEKFALFPPGAMVLVHDEAPVGYALAHPWNLGSIPALDVLLGSLPPTADCLYLHDVAIMPGARGHGSARKLVDRLIDLAERHALKALALTSVYGTHDFWSGCGFADMAAPEMAATLATYGGPARYMVRML